MMNEFQRISLTCIDSNLVPTGAGYTDIRYQACTLAGGAAGSNIIPGYSYLSDTFQYDPGQLWRNWGMFTHSS